MKAIVDYVKREPAVILTVLAALFGIAASFGFSLTQEQSGAITALVTILVGFFIRSQVTPTVKVAAEVDVDGDVVTGPAAPPPGEPAAVVTSDDGTGLDPDEHGSSDVGTALITATFTALAVLGVLALYFSTR